MSTKKQETHTHEHEHSHTHGHHHENTKAVLNRMSRAIGHMEAVRTMIEDGRDCSEVLIQIAAVRSNIIMKFCHISEPFLIWCFGSELPIKYVFRYILRVCSLSCASVVRILDS